MTQEYKGIYFTELTLKNVRCFGDNAVLKLSNDKGEWSRWNVILGDNGTGKTTLLQCLAGLEQISVLNKNSDVRDWYAKLMFEEKKINFRRISNQNTEYFESTDIEGLVKINEKPVLLSIIQRGDFFISSYTIERKIEELYILGYGANRRISFQILSEKEIEPENSETLFDDDAKLFNTEEWLLQIEFAASRDSEIKDIAIKRRDLIKDALKKILPDITEIRFKDSVNIDKPVPRLEFKSPYGWVGVKELSFGYKTMVAWIVDVAARMFKRYPNSPNPLEEPVIILVDEIDLHLHPKWQRQIFDFLETRFPRAQFIVTAHSPLIVQSAPRDANIIVLKKEKVGDEYVVRIDNDKNFVRNWRVDQILSSDLFDGVGIRNSEMEKLMGERSTLLKRNDLSKEEQVRLDELNEISHSLPTADNPEDIEAMDIIREAAALLKKQKAK